jgi:hypothetical protein
MGGEGGGGTYYASEIDLDTGSAYGVATYTDLSTLTLNAPDTDTHQDLWVELVIGSGQYWEQAGYMEGTDESGTSSVLVPYAEFNTGTAVSYHDTADPIPAADSGYIEVWTYEKDSSNNYWAQATIDSAYYGQAFSYDYNMGMTYSNGEPYAALEEAYFNSYSSTCNSVSQYTEMDAAVYTTSMSTSSPIDVGTSWSSCSTEFNNSPYHIALVGTCDEDFEYYGS